MLTPVSLMKTNRAASPLRRDREKYRRAMMTSGRFCSAGISDFFERDPYFLKLSAHGGR